MGRALCCSVMGEFELPLKLGLFFFFNSSQVFKQERKMTSLNATCSPSSLLCWNSEWNPLLYQLLRISIIHKCGLGCSFSPSGNYPWIICVKWPTFPSCSWFTWVGWAICVFLVLLPSQWGRNIGMEDPTLWWSTALPLVKCSLTHFPSINWLNMGGKEEERGSGGLGWSWCSHSLAAIPVNQTGSAG